MARMGYQLKNRKQAWRMYLTVEEIARVDAIEKSRRPSAAMQLELIRIRARAAQRASRERKQEGVK